LYLAARCASLELQIPASFIMRLFGEVPAQVLEQDQSVIFGLDSNLHIVYCNAAWDAFAAANGGRDLLRPAPIGHFLLGYVSGPVVEYYAAAFESVLKTAQPWRHVYECSSATTFRKFAMQVLPIPRTHGLLVVNSLCVERPHEPSRNGPPPPEYRSTAGIVVMCSHCRRTKRAVGEEQWDWVPEHVEHLPANTSHGLCGICLEYYYPQGSAAPISGPSATPRFHR
jgi:hypothetical protein